MRTWAPLALLVLAAALTASALEGHPRSPSVRAATCLGKKATLVGTSRADKLTGTQKADVITGLAGNDTLDGRGGDDVVCGGSGADRILGGAGRDRADGGTGHDTCLSVEKKAGCEPAGKPKPRSERDFTSGPLPAGTYVNTVFKPPVSFKLGAGWEGRTSPGFAASTFLLLRTVGPRTPCSSVTGNLISFARFRPQQSVSATVARLSALPGTSATAPVDTTVGTASGKQLELTATGSRCITLGEIGLDFTMTLDPGDRFRVYVVDVAGATVVVGFGGQSAAFASFAPEAEAVISSIRWR